MRKHKMTDCTSRASAPRGETCVVVVIAEPNDTEYDINGHGISHMRIYAYKNPIRDILFENRQHHRHEPTETNGPALRPINYESW